MSRYIDAVKLKNDLMEFTPYAFDSSFKDINTSIDMFTVIEILDEQPTADVQEVKHGKWVEDEFGDIICSECKQYPIENEDGYQITELKEYIPFYCPNCGAKMDGE